MAGRYDEKVFTIWYDQSLSAAIQYYLFKKYNQKRFVFEIDEVYETFKRYWKACRKSYGENNLEKMFKYELEQERNKRVFEYGQYDCKDTLYFSMEPKYKIPCQ